MVGVIVAGFGSLIGVLLGGWLTVRNNDRMAQRENVRQWRDIRLLACNQFLTAHRKYVSFILEPTAVITAIPHPRDTAQLMPFFDESGRPYKEELESTFTAMRLVAENPETVRAGVQLVRGARRLAAARASLPESDLPSDDFQELWNAEQKFLNSMRAEIGLPPMPRQP
ncbi:hypothetical protein [Streptomyces microflavus]|uniref:hypothetical protein n=1 Tax=Streptomyces microflavus TaxID=1919 RepID=UPI00382B672B